MADSPQKRSFSGWRRWRIALQVGVLVLLVLSVLVMLNYLSQDHYSRWILGERRALRLTQRTSYFLRSLTNDVKIVVYFDKEDAQGLYTMVADLLNEYKAAASSKISVRTVDYLRETAAAQKVKADYKLTQPTDKNLVIFDCEGRHKAVPADTLIQVELERLADEPGSKKPLFRRRPVASYAEAMFDAALLDVTSRRRYKAYFLTGHGEHGIDSGDPLTGYLVLASIFQQNYLQVQPLALGTNGVPKDCDLLVVGGPNSALLDPELESIERYLNQGGQMLALFNSLTERETGLEKLLGAWGVRFSSHPVVDPEHTDPREGGLVVSAFSKHPLVNPLIGYGLYLVRPRAVGAPQDARSQGAEAPRVDEIAFSGTNACLTGISDHPPQRFPLAVAVEKGVIKGVSSERGTTRIVVVGDSFFLANSAIDQMANRDFAFCAVNWLLDRPRLLGGVGPRPLKEYRLLMTRAQLQRAEWILLGGMPGMALLIGTAVWVRRRN